MLKVEVEETPCAVAAPQRRAAAEVALKQPPGSRVTTRELLNEVEEYFTIGARVSPGDTVVDVGANVGAFSLRVAERCAGNVRLLCFEPSPDTVRALRSNFAAQPLLRRTDYSIHPLGLTSPGKSGRELAFYNFRRFPTNNTLDLAGKRQEFELFFADRGDRLRRKLAAIPVAGRGLGKLLEAGISSLPRGPVGWWLSRRVMGLEEVKVRTETLDAALARHRIARVQLLKIDVEGAELDVLLGLGERSWPLVQQVVMETHNRDGRQETIERLLRAHGLTEIRTAAQAAVDNGQKSVLLLASRPGRTVGAPGLVPSAGA